MTNEILLFIGFFTAIYFTFNSIFKAINVLINEEGDVTFEFALASVS